MNFRRLSLLWKIWLSTSVALTAMFVVMGVFLERSVRETAAYSLQQEVRSNSKTYEALWRARAEQLESLATALSTMPVIRKAATGPDAEVAQSLGTTLRKSVGDREGQSFLLITDPSGRARTFTKHAGPSQFDPRELVQKGLPMFPVPLSGFLVQNSVLYQVVVAPIYGDLPGKRGQLQGTLLLGFVVDGSVAKGLKDGTGGSEFIFAKRGQIFASSLDDRTTGNVVRGLVLADQAATLISDGKREYVPFSQPLVDFEGKTLGKLIILRSFEGARSSISGLRRRFMLIWAAAVVMGLLLTYSAVERIVKPLKDLDRAATEVAMENYDHRVAVSSDDELGRLASTFNKMIESLQAARAELIRRERIGTIGRLASSIVHDLRNPLAAIYGGSEMLVDTQPTPDQSRRIAENIHRASRRIQELLEDLVRVTRGKTKRLEACKVRDLVRIALMPLEANAHSQEVKLLIRIGDDLEVQVDRPRLEGVFFNLAQNALDVMPGGGMISICAQAEGGWVTVEVADSGPGIPQEIRDQLFQPFITHGKKNGLGLGLALARQTVLDHGGDLWVSSEEGRGARFYLRLPRNHLI